jgi:hypothetical protein
VSVLIRPLRLDGFEQLPKHARRCVFWEVDPRTLAGEHLPDPEFEKEAWLSMVMLEWGSCGQIATSAPRDDSRDAEEPCLGYVLYAPPRAVPRAQQFPTGPVSADAVLLTSMGVEPGQPEGLPAMCSFDQCMIDAGLLLDTGFTVAAPHRYFPRLRLELDRGLGWKAEVEAALERLLEGAELQQPVGSG